jgi:hypothetical protein
VLAGGKEESHLQKFSDSDAQLITILSTLPKDKSNTRPSNEAISLEHGV